MSVLVPISDRVLGVPLEKAADILEGLASHRYFVDGGVVRRVGDKKQIVAILRQIPDKAITSEALKTLTAITQGATAASVLNLGISAMGFAAVLQQLGKIEKRLEAIGKQLEKIDFKLDLQIYANLHAALNLADKALTMKGDAARHGAASEAVMSLLNAGQTFLGLLDRELDARGGLVVEYLNTLFLIHTSIARCWAQLEQIDTAREHIQQQLATLEPRVHEYREKVLGANLAIFLHPDLSKKGVTLERIARLMRYEDEDITAAELFEQHRAGLWEVARQDPKTWAKRLPSYLSEYDADHQPAHKRLPLPEQPDAGLEARSRSPARNHSLA